MAPFWCGRIDGEFLSSGRFSVLLGVSFHSPGRSDSSSTIFPMEMRLIQSRSSGPISSCAGSDVSSLRKW